MMGKEILVVDDEIGIRELLSEILMDEGYDVTLADGADEARAVRARMRPDLVLLDIWMPETDGITLLREWERSGVLDMPVVMMSGHGTIDTAVEAMRVGAIGFLEKPISLRKLLDGVATGLRHPLPRKTAQLVPMETVPVSPVRAPAALVAPEPLPAPGYAVEESHSPGEFSIPFNLPLREARDLFERRYFEWLIGQTEGNMTRAAEQAGVERTHLYRKLKQLGVNVGKKNLQEE